MGISELNVVETYFYFTIREQPYGYINSDIPGLNKLNVRVTEHTRIELLLHSYTLVINVYVISALPQGFL